MSDAPILVEDPAPPARMPRSLEESWKRCGSRLRAELGEDIFSSWFGRLELEAVANRHARFTVPTRFLKSWIESHYVDRLLATLNGEIGEIAGLTLAVRSSTQSPLAAPLVTVRRAAAGEAAPAESGAAPRQDAGAGRSARRAATTALSPAPETRSPARRSIGG